VYGKSPGSGPYGIPGVMVGRIRVSRQSAGLPCSVSSRADSPRLELSLPATLVTSHSALSKGVSVQYTLSPSSTASYLGKP
jgi:hypothetical protein